MNTISTLSFDLASLQAAYAAGATVRQVIGEAQRRCADDASNAFIHRLDLTELEPYLARLEQLKPSELPLYGVPFAIKDNIDLAGVPTTAGCPEYAYTPQRHAFVVQQLIDAGAVPMGKTNLDQFATGLNGTRSPYGPGINTFDERFISGGSSAGSAISTAKGWVSFALGTDTAGSGRVPASFNQLVGLKPTCGLLSTSGVVPACRSLDTVSIFALTSRDALAVLDAARGFDAADPYSRDVEPWGVDWTAGRFRFGVPRQQDLEFFGNDSAAALFRRTVAHLEALGGVAVEIDMQPFIEAALLLYEGPWVAERFLAIRDFLAAHPEQIFPAVRAVIETGASKSAADTFAAIYRLRSLKRSCDAIWRDVDCLLTPTAGTIYRIDAMQADPIRLNSNLGRYTNFVNLLDYAAVAVPSGILADGEARGLPWGVTLVAPAQQDVPLLRLADRLHRHAAGEAHDAPARLGATTTALSSTPALGPDAPCTWGAGTVRVAVCGAHMQGLPLNPQLTQRGARLVQATRSAPVYRFYALEGAVKRPGMVRVEAGGASIELEVWELPAQAFGSFVDGIPTPLGIGKVLLESGEWVTGFICEGVVAEKALDITSHGGWRAWLAADHGGHS
jgi:allophanate hydrolase